MNNDEIIDALRDAVDIINRSIEHDASQHYNNVILDSKYQGDYLQAYKDKGWCRDEEETVAKLEKIIGQLEDE